MLYHLLYPLTRPSGLQRLPVHHLPERRRGDHGADRELPARPRIIRWLRALSGQQVRDDGPQTISPSRGPRPWAVS